jgi:hypothetical protein
MISLAGIAIFIFGNKIDAEGKIIHAGGVKREFEIAVDNGLLPIPISVTGYISEEIYNIIMESPERYYAGVEWVIPLITELADKEVPLKDIIDKVITIIQKINK